MYTVEYFVKESGVSIYVQIWKDLQVKKIKVPSKICINPESHLYKKIHTRTLCIYVTYMEYVLYIHTHLHVCINITCTSYM